MTAFPRFGPNGAWALFNDEGDVPPGWQPTEEAARRMQTLAPPVQTMGEPMRVSVVGMGIGSEVVTANFPPAIGYPFVPPRKRGRR